MKRSFIVLLTLGALSALQLAAAPISLEAGATFWDLDAGAVNYKTGVPIEIPYANVGSKAKLGDGTLSYGLYAEEVIAEYPRFQSVYDSTSKINGVTYHVYPAEAATAGKAEPYAQYALGGLTLRVSFPQYYFSPKSDENPTDKNGYALFKWQYKAIGLQYYGSDVPNTDSNTKATTSYNSDFNAGKSFISTNYDKLAYKYAFSDKFSLTAQVEGDVIFVPVAWLADVKPDISCAYGPATLDAKLSYYSLKNPIQVYTKADKSQWDWNTDVLTFDPKLTVAFDSLGVKNFKAWIGASIPAGKTEYFDDLGLNVIPGASYKLGGFYFEGNLKMNYLDYQSGDGAPTGVYKHVEFDPNVKLAYTFSF
jgi:hypothetical protein